MKSFREVDGNSLDSLFLQEEMNTYGYVLIRKVLPPEILNDLAIEVVSILNSAGWLIPGSNPQDRIANPDAACKDDDPTYKDVYDRVFSLRSFHALPHLPVMQHIMKQFVGEELLIHPKSAARLIFPNFGPGIIHAHQDHTAVAGDTETFTAWLPLHDCPTELGPLRILEGSHLYGLQPTAGRTGYIAAGTERGDDWAAGEINCGDLLIFHSLTVHEAAPNHSNQLRLSLDCRFQSYLRPVNPGVLVFTGSGRRSWERTYANWPTSELKHYWRAIPLELKPSIAELLELAQTSEQPEMRQRNARILARIEAEMALIAT